MGEYSGRCQRYRGTQNIAGDPRLFLSSWGIRKYHGGLRKIHRGHPEGTSTGSVLERCIKDHERSVSHTGGSRPNFDRVLSPQKSGENEFFVCFYLLLENLIRFDSRIPVTR